MKYAIILSCLPRKLINFNGYYANLLKSAKFPVIVEVEGSRFLDPKEGLTWVPEHAKTSINIFNLWKLDDFDWSTIDTNLKYII